MSDFRVSFHTRYDTLFYTPCQGGKLYFCKKIKAAHKERQAVFFVEGYIKHLNYFIISFFKLQLFLCPLVEDIELVCVRLFGILDV